MTRPLYVIADEVREKWGRVSPFAKPYLSAMGCVSSVKDKYGLDDARSIVLYFLSNAQTWRGPDARRIKAELKGMLG